MEYPHFKIFLIGNTSLKDPFSIATVSLPECKTPANSIAATPNRLPGDS